MKKTLYLGLSIGIVALMTSCGGGSSKKGDQAKTSETPSKTIKLSGAGATFPQPFYNLAFTTYNKATGVQVDYGAIGSGGGIKSLKDKIVDFGASDAFLSEKEADAMPGQVFHIPTCMGAVVLSYNLPGVESLKLSGTIIADIFLGKIKNWNNAEIAKENPGVTLPNKKITPVYRSDGSGTTFIFSDYLSKVSPEWNKELGRGKSLNWNNDGVASKGNPGVAGNVKNTVGSIGYIGSEYAFAMNIPMAQLKNSSGNYITPNTESISAAASTDLPADNRAMLTNTAAANGYPISAFTWILIYKEQSYGNHTKENAKATMDLIKWMLTPQAQALTTSVHYAPLPETAIANSKALLEQVVYNGEKL